MEKDTNSLNDSFGSDKGKDKKITIQLTERKTVDVIRNLQYDRVMLICHEIHLYRDGKKKETEQGKSYRVDIDENGIHFKEPLVFVTKNKR